MKGWIRRALISLSVAVACAKATDEDLLPSGEDDSGGTSGTGASPFGGASRIRRRGRQGRHHDGRNERQGRRHDGRNER